MKRRRLKDLIRMPDRNSAFASFLSGVIMLLAFVAVCKTLDEQGLLDLGSGAPKIRAKPVNETATFTATAHHQFYWNDEGPYPLEEFSSRLTGWTKTVQKPAVVIAGDSTALLSDTMRLLDEVRRQGIASSRLEARVRDHP